MGALMPLIAIIALALCIRPFGVDSQAGIEVNERDWQ